MDSAELKHTLRSINIDVLWTVSERTFLSPFFACWIPLIALGQSIVHGKPILELEPDELKKTFGVNVFAHFYIYKAFLPDMIKRNSGHIVTMASILGHVGVARVADYCASKAAAILLHQSLREEYHAPGVRTTLVCPGLMTTKMFEDVQTWNEFLFPKLSPHEIMKKIIQTIDNEDSSEIYLPLYTKFNFIFNLSDFFLVPSWLLSFLHWFVGSNRAYIGSSKKSK
ncbi:hypothetical protein PtB15_18B293 [Puccinia triticina]|nr:hypothetical protein PtB15_18B293 [Puccinia triticina]